MQRYIYEASYTKELDDAINSRPHLKLLVEEMFYKYGLKAYEFDTRSSGVYMTIEGLPYCLVYAYEFFDEKTEKDGVDYCYYTPLRTKERGSDYEDRHTWRSTKLSSLMRILDKKKLVPSDFSEIFNYTSLLDFVDLVKDASPTIHKSMRGFESAKDVQPLLEYLLDNKPVPAEKMNDYKVILDRWRELEQNKSDLNDKINTMFSNEFYLIGENKSDGYVIGSLRITDLNQIIKDSSYHYTLPDKEYYEMVKPFQRVKSLDDYEFIDEIRPALTMYKISLEGREIKNNNKYVYEKEGQISPARRAYYDDVGVITNGGGDPMLSAFRLLWTLIPTQI